MEDRAKLEELLRQEEELQLDEFTNDTAIAIGERLIAIARDEKLPITIDLTRNGQQLFHASLPGTCLDNDEWVQRKNRVVLRFGHSSYYIGLRYKAQNTTIEAKSLLKESEYAPHGGGFPIIVKNVGVVGTVTVSGLAQADDHALVVRVLHEFVTEQTPGRA